MMETLEALRHKQRETINKTIIKLTNKYFFSYFCF